MCKPKMLDLFCGGGGATWGYLRAGFDVVGVDVVKQPNYPKQARFVQADAMTYPLDGFDFIHASPPCQRYSTLSYCRDLSSYPDLVDPVRDRLEGSGALWVIENVPGAPLRNPVMLCGTMFGLRVLRHRHFESNFVIRQPEHPAHVGTVRDGDYLPVYGNGGRSAAGAGRVDAWRQAMGIWWMRKGELAEAIPPAYSEYIGREALRALGAVEQRVLA